MRAMRLAGQVICLLAFINVLAVGQTVDKQSFAKDGLSFDYPAGWTLQDESNGDLQQLITCGHAARWT